MYTTASYFFFFFFFNDTATTEIYTLSLHDALPICIGHRQARMIDSRGGKDFDRIGLCREVAVLEGPAMIADRRAAVGRSEEHTSELQSRQYLVCRLLLEKKKIKDNRSVKLLQVANT